MGSIKKFLNSRRGERIDAPDFQHLAEVGPLNALAQILSKIIIGDPGIGSSTQPKMFVLKGFEPTIDTGVVTISNGTAILAQKYRGDIVYGALVTEGDETKVIDVSSYANSGTPYGVFIRFDLQETDFKNRPSWNPLSSTPAEFVRNISTRLSESWSLAIELQAPGEEWLKIAEVTKNGGPITIADKRNFFFEGTDDNNWEVVNTEWGTAADHTSDRANQGVFGFYRAIRGLQRQVQDIIGGTAPNKGWYVDLTAAGASSLKSLKTNKLNRDGTDTVTGVLTPDADSTRDLGTNATRFKHFYVDDIDVSNNVFANGTIDATGDISSPADVNGGNVTAGNFENGFTFNGTTRDFYAWLDASMGVWKETVPTGEVRHIIGNPLSITNPDYIEANPTTATVEVVFPVKLPQGVTWDKLTAYLVNNSASATRASIWRQKLSDASLAQLRSGGEFSFGSIAGGDIGTATDIVLDQNNVIDNHLYRYFVVVRLINTFQTLWYGSQCHYTSDKMVIPG